MRRVARCLFLLLSSCVAGQEHPRPPAPPASQPGPGGEGSTDFSFPEPDLSTATALSLWATTYHIYRVQSFDTGPVPLLDQEGNPLGATLSERDFCLGAIEGTIRVSTPERTVTYNYTGTASELQVDCNAQLGSTRFPGTGKSRFRITPNPYGDGVKGPLVPFRTLAVDPKVIAPGSVIYIPEARGLRLQDGEGGALTHDGYFFAADRGGHIKENHIDLFIATLKDSQNPFPFARSKPTPTFAAYLLEGSPAEAYLKKLHAWP
jgi:3D (Asp-Asp-Asp) domain-containing protein